MRLFSALVLPEDFRKDLYLQREALRQSHPTLRWIKWDNFHITLQFLGELTPREGEEAAYLLEKAAAEAQPFTIKTSGPGQFPGAGKPRVIFESLSSGIEECRTIHKNYSRRLLKEEFSLEKRKYNPHITLCRLSPCHKWHESQNREVTLNPLECRIHSAGIFRSTLQATGACYELLTEFNFKG